MKFNLKGFQQDAVEQLLKTMRQMRVMYENPEFRTLSSTVLAAPTGSGKTVMAAATIESLFFGDPDLGLDPDPHAVVLWLCDSPALNMQTLYRFVQASDRLADNFMDQRHLQIVDSHFCKSHERLDARVVYFLSKNMLSSAGLLTKGGEENNGRLFWDVLDQTIQDPDRRLYLFIDEAHRGLGKNASDSSKQQTIYAHLIDGFEGRHPMPIVVGVSATPKRFEDAMRNRENRTLMPAVQVKPSDVQESGLLKDVIELRVPEQGDPVEHQYLDMAADRLDESELEWHKYCDGQGIPPVLPLMVVQVEDKISDEKLGNICRQLMKRLPQLDGLRSFAHVFDTHERISPAKNVTIPYVSPEVVQGLRNIRVLFAKEAISNGWDCPRAEVIFSQRRRLDTTYIAQLIGRMVRTPLGRRIEGNDLLNGVACYLPQFDPKGTQSVVDYLTGKTDEIDGGVGVRKVFTNPVPCVWAGAVYEYEDEELGNPSVEPRHAETSYAPTFDGLSDGTITRESDGDGSATQTSNVPPEPDAAAVEANRGDAPTQGEERIQERKANVPVTRPRHERPKPVAVFNREDVEGIREAYLQLRKRRVEKKARNEFNTLVDTTTLMADTGLDKAADRRETTAFCNKLDGEIITYPDAYEAQERMIRVAETHVITIDKLHDNTVTTSMETPDVDAEGAADAAVKAQTLFGMHFCQSYRRFKNGQGMSLRESNIRLAAAARTDEIMQDMKNWARERRSQYFKDHAADRAMLSDEMRARYDELDQFTRGILDSPLMLPRYVEENAGAKEYERHIVYNPKTGRIPLELNRWEQHVVEKEMGKNWAVAFYRNPGVGYNNRAFSFPYRAPNGDATVRPDFIFFVRTNDGIIKPAIVDPHGAHLSDTIPKLQGYVEYLRDYPDMFAFVYMVSSVGNNSELRFLNLLDEETQKMIMNPGQQSAEELFAGELSQHYGNLSE